jgi:hypothetical protein
MKTDKPATDAKPSKSKKERALISLDYALKRLLRNKANYDVLEGFLSELLGRDVRVKSIAESESNQQRQTGKYNRVDIMVENEEGELIIIELQFNSEMDYFHRMLFSASKAIADHMSQGDTYVNVRKVYSINIVYFDLGQAPTTLTPGKGYYIVIRTQSSAVHGSNLLKDVREVKSEFTVTAPVSAQEESPLS